MKQIFHTGFAGIEDIKVLDLASSRVIDKLGHTYLHMLVVCSRDLKIPGAHSHDLSYAIHPRYNPDSGICPQPQKSKLAFKHPCELQVPLCVFL